MRALRLLPALAAAAALLAAAPAPAQALPPSLTVDPNYAFSGIVEHDFTVVSGVSRDTAAGAAIDPALDRHYAVGEGTTAGGGDIAVVARRSNGALDATFAGDGALAEDISLGGRDFGTDMVVLPDHRLRILGASGGDIVLLGLLPNGSRDPDFGVDGLVTFDAGDVNDVPRRMAIDAAGLIAITGGTGPNTFVAVREADGSPAPFGTVELLDIAGADHGADVAWRGDAPVALVQAGDTALLRAFTSTGLSDPSFAGGEVSLGDDTTAGGLTTYGGRLWTTGAYDPGGDVDAFVARVNGDGSGLQSRRFDIRGTFFPGNQQVSSRGFDLDVARGEPDTLVVAGSVTTDPGSEWGAMAFNGLDGDLAAMQTGDVVLPVSGPGEAAYGIAAGANGVLALAGTTIEPPPEDGGSNDSSIGMARLLVDAEKHCDLGLSIAAPLELVIRGTGTAGVTLVARNGGLRACGGSVSVPGPYGMAPGTLQTGRIEPGQSVVLSAQVGRPAPYPVDDSLAFTLSSPADVAPGDNVARLHVAFSYCDLRLVRAGSPRFIGNEGTRLYEFSVRNAGTETCRSTAIAVGGAGARSGRIEPYSVPAGQSVTDEMEVRVRRGTPVGRAATIAFTALDPAELLAVDNTLTSRPMVVRAGDSSARRPTGRRRFSGTAKDGRARGVRKRSLKVARVEIAVRKAGKGCRWLSDSGGDLRKVTPGRRGACDEPVWVRATGTRDWRLKVRRALPKGRYTLFSRAVTANGVAEGRFGFKDGNKLRFRLG
jgi:hypothetical protein